MPYKGSQRNTPIAGLADTTSLSGELRSPMAGSGWSVPTIPDPDYNVAVIVVDDLRADHLSCHGYERKTTPHLDERLRNGTYFRNCMTPSGWTLSACASILTGQLADQHGLIDHHHQFRKPKLGHYLEGHYDRAAFTNNGNTIPDSMPVGYLEGLGFDRRPAKWRFFGWDDGFDSFAWTAREDHMRPFEIAGQFLSDRRSADSRPWFLFFHTNLVHDYHMDRPYYLEVEDWLGREIHPSLRDFRDGPWVWTERPSGVGLDQMKEEIIAKYDSGIRATDRLLEKLFCQLDFDRTIVVLVSDHGEGFEPELGRVHHCGRLHQDLLHVPLAVWLPPELRANYEVSSIEDRFVSVIDIVPTVLTLLGATVDGLPGRHLFDSCAHRRLEGVDRGYIYWNEDCRRESYDTARIEIRSELVYPLKRIQVCKNDVVREYAYNLAYDPGETDNLLGRRGRDDPELEPVSFVVAVNDREELQCNLLASPVAQSSRHRWILVDNVGNKRYDTISALYNEALDMADTELVFFVHEDLYLPVGWELSAARGLAELGRLDRNWGVVGAVGAIAAEDNRDGSKILKGHWCDPHGYSRQLPLPHEVESLDEQWLGIRKSSGVRFDSNLPGFHCYGIDLSLSARERGMKSYAIDAFVWHKFADCRGRLITRREDSSKIMGRWTEGFMADFNPSADYVEKKWSKFLPFQTTSWNWK